MKTLRAKLFISVGSILLIVACLSYLLPEIFIRRELRRGGVYITQYVQHIQQKILQTSSFILLYRFMESGASLVGESKRVEQVQLKDIRPWNFAVEIAAYDPEISFVQITLADGRSVVVTPEDTILYPSQINDFKENMLWVQVEGKEDIFLALRIDETQDYLLFDQKQLKGLLEDQTLDPKLRHSFTLAVEYLEKNPHMTFPAFPPQPTPPSIHSSEQFYRFLLQKQTLLEEKLALIKKLVVWQDAEVHPVGLFRLTQDTKEGKAIFTQQAFSMLPWMEEPLQSTEEPEAFFHPRKGYTEVEAASVIIRHDPEMKIAIGFSVSEIIQQVAQLIERPILITQGQNFIVGISPDGEHFNDVQIKGPKNLTWRGVEYVPFQIPLEKLNLAVLTKKSEVNEMQTFLGVLSSRLMLQISLNLVGATLLSLGIALLLLGRISKTITSPIALLARAAEKIGEGKSEQVQLPDIEKRQDEVATLTQSFRKMILALKDRETIRGMLSKVVSKEIAEKILSRTIELEGEERVATLLFSDIRGFTHLSEHMKPKVLIKVLNTYMTRMCAIIDSTYGVVDKFVGDEIMALYGVPVDLENHALQAIQAAVEMMRDLKSWQATSVESFSIGIGIHTGLVCAGNMGSENRLNYTVVGANVNLAARLCEHAAPMQILISEETWKQPGVQSTFRFKKLEPIHLKGIGSAVIVYEVEF